MDLVPVSSLVALASVLTFGASKYSDRNWERGLAWSRPYGAALRHLTAWWAGENLDPETGYSHLWHALTELAFLVEYEKTHPELDNRPQGSSQCSDDTQTANCKSAVHEGWFERW